jgi:hypothetical protein
LRNTIIATMAAMPEKMAPATKYGPKMVECHIGWIVMEKTKETTVWTEMAMGITSTAMIAIARFRTFCWRALPVQPRARIV